jgi:hypothetical protein
MEQMLRARAAVKNILIRLPKFSGLYQRAEKTNSNASNGMLEDTGGWPTLNFKKEKIP